jgi:hypothetical protein
VQPQFTALIHRYAVTVPNTQKRKKARLSQIKRAFPISDPKLQQMPKFS